MSKMTKDGDATPPDVLPDAPCILRGPEPGDGGYVVECHGVLYAREYGFDERFEGLVAEIMARFLRGHDAERERLWIAEIAGRRVGSVMLTQESQTLARLRVLLVDPVARGRRVGKRLVEECTGFARSQGYERMTLTTVSRLTAARHIYEAVGFRLVSEKEVHEWSQDLVFEEWELDLR